jgi:hypothetical protein
MPPVTRAAKRKAASRIWNWWSKNKDAVVIDTALPTNWRERSLNETDPITMEDIGELDPGNVFLHVPNAELEEYHAYNAQQLFKYIESTCSGASPLTRALFSKTDLRRLSQLNGRHRNYLLAVIKFGKWRNFLPTHATVATSEIDTLWQYVELLVLLSQEREAMKLYDLCLLLVFPWIWHTLEALHSQAQAHMQPPVTQVLPALMCRLQDMTSGQFRDNTRDFFNNVMARYAVIESGIQN